MTSQSQQSEVLVLFGAIGDLAHRKIFPAILSLYERGLDFPIISIAKSGLNRDALVAHLAGAFQIRDRYGTIRTRSNERGETTMGFALSDMTLTSAAFDNGGSIPTRHTGEGADVSPALSWSGAPEGTASFALICHDPDAPLVSPGNYGFVHWVLYGIPPSVSRLAEGSEDYTQGVNNFGKNGYGGPMPPEGHGRHHYFFWLLALAAAPKLEPGLAMWDLLEKIEPDVIAMNRLVGTYERF